MTDIFISYSRPDRQIAQVLAQSFEDDGHTVWWDARLEAGSVWDEVIEEQLNSARAVIVIWSTNSKGSTWVRNEARFASKKGILFPVLIEKVEPPIEFSHLQGEDLSGWSGDVSYPGYKRLLGAINKKLEVLVKRSTRGEEQSGKPEPEVFEQDAYTPFHSLLYDKRKPLEAYREGIAIRGSVHIDGDEPSDSFRLGPGALFITDVPIDDRHVIEELLGKFETYLDSRNEKDFILIAPSISGRILDYLGARRSTLRICSISFGGIGKHMMMVLQDLAVLTGAVMNSKETRGELARQYENGFMVIESNSSNKVLLEVTVEDLGKFQEASGNAKLVTFRGGDPQIAAEFIQERLRELEVGSESARFKADRALALDRMIRLAGSAGEDYKDWNDSKNIEVLSIETKDIENLPIFHPPTIELGRADSIILGRGYASPYLITNLDTLSVEYDQPLLLIYAGHLDIEPIIPLIDVYFDQVGSGLTIIAHSLSDSLIATFSVNKLRGMLDPLLIALDPVAFDTHQALQEMADLLGTRVFDKPEDLNSLSLDELGSAAHISSSGYETTITLT